MEIRVFQQMVLVVLEGGLVVRGLLVEAGEREVPLYCTGQFSLFCYRGSDPIGSKPNVNLVENMNLNLILTFLIDNLHLL